jgi:hypothetical protein
VLFTPRFGEETRAHEETTQLSLVSLSAPIQPNALVRARVASITVTGSQPIPPDSVVLAARGVAAYALRDLDVGDEVGLSLLIEPDAGEVREAVSGGPRLLRDGLISVEHARERFSRSFAERSHPRTGVGLRGGSLVLVAVDGRQPGYSEGMSLYQMAELFLELGCTDAMNLDGGGSTTMVVRDQIVNSPSSGVPRAVANGLALYTTAPVGPPTHLSVEPATVCVLPSQQVQLGAVVLDHYYSPTPVGPGDIEWECPDALGGVDAAGLYAAPEVGRPVTGGVTARLGELAATVVVTVTPAPARVVVVPRAARMLPGSVRQFFVSAYDGENRAILLPGERVAWSLEATDADCSMDSTGQLRAPPHDGRLMVVADVCGVQGQAEVVVGLGLPAAEDFETSGIWSYLGRPSSVPGAVEWAEDPLAHDNHCLLLRYDFSQEGGTRTANALLDLALPEAGTFSLRVLGDGKGTWLRARLRDAAGQAFAVDLANEVNWVNEWRWLTAEIPQGAEVPVTVESVYVAEYHDAHRPAGEMYLDDIGVTPIGEDND